MRRIAIQEVWAGMSYKGQRGKASISMFQSFLRNLSGERSKINTREIPESIFGEILQFDSWEILEPSSEENPNTCS